MLYTAFVSRKNAEPGQAKRLFLTYDYPNKTAFMADLRANGYGVIAKHVRPASVYAYILENFNGDELVCRYLTEKNVQDLNAGLVSISGIEEAARERYERLKARREKRPAESLADCDAMLARNREKLDSLNRRDELEHAETVRVLTPAELDELDEIREKLLKFYDEN